MTICFVIPAEAHRGYVPASFCFFDCRKAVLAVVLVPELVCLYKSRSSKLTTRQRTEAYL